MLVFGARAAGERRRDVPLGDAAVRPIEQIHGAAQQLAGAIDQPARHRLHQDDDQTDAQVLEAVSHGSRVPGAGCRVLGAATTRDPGQKPVGERGRRDAGGQRNRGDAQAAERPRGQAHGIFFGGEDESGPCVARRARDARDVGVGILMMIAEHQLRPRRQARRLEIGEESIRTRDAREREDDVAGADLDRLVRGERARAADRPLDVEYRADAEQVFEAVVARRA